MSVIILDLGMRGSPCVSILPNADSVLKCSQHILSHRSLLGWVGGGVIGLAVVEVLGRELPSFGCITPISMSHVLSAQSLKSILLWAFETISSCVVRTL